MVDSEHTSLPEATVVPPNRARISVVWLIPVLAALVAIGIAVQRILSEGPTVKIIFNAAQGIEAGKTAVKYKDVTIGLVSALQLTSDYSQVEVTAKITKSAAGLMVEDAKFWVVEPRITLSGVSGLGTLLSGNYIGFGVGSSQKRSSRFTGLETAPIITGGQPGRQFMLHAAKLGSLGIGAPVYYRSLQAGQVIAYTLAPDGQAIDIKVFVNAPYDRFVTSETRFWNASGIEVSVGAQGVDVQMESLISLLVGGVAFDTPAFAGKEQAAAADTAFTLHADRAAAMKQPETIARRYVLYFNETLRGLSVGAPVTMLGLPAGEVTAVGLDIDPATRSLRGRVEIVAYLERLVSRLAKQTAAGESIVQSTQRRRAFFERMVETRGMRAQLRSGSLLTGQLYVAFDFFPDAPPAKVDWNHDEPVLPVVPSLVPDLEAKLTGILTKLDKLPFEAIGADLTKVLATADGALRDASTMLNGVNADVTPELKTTLDDLRRTLAIVDDVLKNGINGTLTHVNTALDELRGPLATANVVLKNADTTLLNNNAPVQQDLRDALQEVSRAARSLRGLTDYLERHPDSLIRGKTEEKR